MQEIGKSAGSETNLDDIEIKSDAHEDREAEQEEVKKNTLLTGSQPQTTLAPEGGEASEYVPMSAFLEVVEQFDLFK